MKKIVMVVMILIGIISLVFAIQGIAMHVKVNNIENKFHQAQENYFLIDKSTRDAAPANSQLNQQLVEIKNTPSDLLRLKLVGIGKILVGIYGLLFAILIALMVMPIRLGRMMKK